MRTLATVLLASAGLLAAGSVFAGPIGTPSCGDEVKKPTDDGTKEPPKTSTDPQCGDEVKKPTGDDGKDQPPKT